MKVSVIIPTMASSQRGSLLKRAINSIRRSSKLPISIIVVVNGQKSDPEICEWLKCQNDITFEFLEIPSAPKAIHRGIELVSTEYFATLDDDDEFLELAVDERLLAIESESDIDFVITNGYRNETGTDSPWHNKLSNVQIDPLISLMEKNWLTSCNAIFRKSSIGSDIFFDSHPYGEWTWLAFKLILTGKRVAVLNTATFRINDTPGSLSKSRGYEESYISLFKRMLDLNPPESIKTQIRKKLSAAYHDASDAALNRGDKVNAVKWHWQSLLEKGGSRYLGYSRHLLTQSKRKNDAESKQ